MSNFKIYLIIYFFGIIVASIGGIILYHKIGGWGLFGLFLLLFGNDLTGPYKEEDKMKDRIRTKTTDNGEPRGNGGSPLLMTIAIFLFCLMVGAVIGDALKSICK